MKPIKMVDLQTQYQRYKTEINRTISEVLNTSAYIKGKPVRDFEEHLAEYLGVKHVITCGNGTDALQIAMMALELKPGDEVITTPFTFVSTLEVIALLGLTPVLVDVDSNTFNIDPKEIAKKITSRTKAIVPVHLFGQCAHMESILELAQKHHLYVIEDACQALGTDYIYSDGHRAKAGTIGTIGCTSFFPTKNLGCYGDGGALFCNDDALANRIRSIANHGMEQRYYYERIGINSRLDTIQAAILDVKLKHLDEDLEARQKAAAFYDNALNDCSYLKIPQKVSYSTHTFHQYTVTLKNEADRTALKEYLESQGIPSMIYYPVPLHVQKAYSFLGYKKRDFPVAEYLSDHVLSLPIHFSIEEEQIINIHNTLKRLLNSNKILK